MVHKNPRLSAWWKEKLARDEARREQKAIFRTLAVFIAIIVLFWFLLNSCLDDGKEDSTPPPVRTLLI